MALVQGRLSGRAINGAVTSRQRADVAVRACPWDRTGIQVPQVSLRISGGWIPSNASPAAWWRADMLRTPQFWEDISGNGNSAYQVNGPDWESSSSTAINGRACARFQATGAAFGCYDLPNIAALTNSNLPITIVCVYKLSTGLPANSRATPIVVSDNYFGYTSGILVTNEAGYKSTTIAANSTSGSYAVGYGSAPDTSGHAVTFYCDAVDPADPTSYTATDNAASETISTSDLWTAQVGLGYLDLGLGSGSTQVLDLAEAIVFVGALSGDNATALDAYLLARYGLGAAVDAVLDGAATCATASSAAITGDHPITGASTAASSSAGALAGDHPLDGAASCQATSAAALSADHAVDGAATCATASLADLAGEHPIDGAATSATATTADLEALHPVDGAATAASSSAADVAGDHPIDGAATCASSSSCELSATYAIDGAATCATSSAASVASDHPIDGAATCGTASDADVGRDVPIEGTATAASSSTADLGSDHPLGGDASGATASAAELASEHPIDGDATCATLSECDLLRSYSIDGAAVCHTSSTCALVVTEPIVAAALSSTVATCARLGGALTSSAALAATTPGVAGASTAAPSLAAPAATTPTSARLSA